jgi:Transposase
MQVVEQRCAFLDVHRDTVMACARLADDGDGRREEVAECGTTTSQLLALSDWLVERRVDLVGMEATGVYWKPVHWILEDAIERVWVINARHMRNVPGRKTDVGDARWGAQLGARPGPPELHSASPNSRATRPDPLPQVGDRGTRPRIATAPQGARRRRSQAVVVHVEGVDQVGSGDDRMLSLPRSVTCASTSSSRRRHRLAPDRGVPRMSTTSVTLPAEFADLEPFADWALPTEGERYAKRIASTMDELQAFYDAAFPRSEAAATYLDQFPMDALPDDAKHLLWLYCALVTVSFPVEVWRQPRVPDSGASSFDAVLEPAI